ncbi:MAG: CehA/McbA family metallohydrolase [Thermoleophilaceae bacterium]
MSAPELHELVCVMHVHSTYSDGTGTVPEIAQAAARAGADAVLLTDHDTLAASEHGEEGWHGNVLVLVGTEISPPNRDHFLAFGIDRLVSRRMSGPEIAAEVREAGGFGFAAHPFSRGSERFSRVGPMPFSDVTDERVGGLELWSFLNDTAERLATLPAVARFIAAPRRVVNHPPADNVATWDSVCARRRMVAIAGTDAHQIGLRIRGRVPVRLMSYRRSFSMLRTHVLCTAPPTGDLDQDRPQVYSALREGRCYLAFDGAAPAAGFSFWAEGQAGTLAMGAEAELGEGYELRARSPRHADLRLFRNGEEIARSAGRGIDFEASEPGAYRVEARLDVKGREVTWVLTNPVYLRAR